MKISAVVKISTGTQEFQTPFSLSCIPCYSMRTISCHIPLLHFLFSFVIETVRRAIVWTTYSIHTCRCQYEITLHTFNLTVDVVLRVLLGCSRVPTFVTTRKNVVRCTHQQHALHDILCVHGYAIRYCYIWSLYINIYPLCFTTLVRSTPKQQTEAKRLVHHYKAFVCFAHVCTSATTNEARASSCRWPLTKLA